MGMPILTDRPYHIACRRGHQARVHSNGWCILCREECISEVAYYQYEDGERERLSILIGFGDKRPSRMPSFNRCAECDGYTDDDADYLCFNCRLAKESDYA
jgi:hypothetical protein